MEKLRRWASDRAALYRSTLLERVVPFWMRLAGESRDGAISNCVDDAGTVLSHDRYLWSQGRALWTFSALYNRIAPRPEWLDVAHGLAGYLRRHGRDANGCWVYRLDERGGVAQGAESIYVDGFVMHGLAEYVAATGDSDAAALAVETWRNVRERLRKPGSYGILPSEMPRGGKVLGVRMLFSLVFHGLGRVVGRQDIVDDGLALADELLRDFRDDEKRAFREFVRLEGGRLEAPVGSVCVPGHVIESMWFLIGMFEDDPDRRGLIPTCCDLIRRHLELAWDEEHGGLRLAVNLDGTEPPAWQKADCKPWWVQVEALVATVYAWLHTRQEWCLSWHEKVKEYAFSRYPVPTGEWTQWLDRRGNTAESAALPVKDPFHLPRALMALTGLLERRMPGLGEAT